jgi:nicotinamide-nucleotide amidase
MSQPRRAAFLAVGSELLRTDRLDTNSLLAARLLARCGYALVEKRIVEDDAAAIAAAIRGLCEHAGLVLVSGGLGPTADDVTREGAARALGVGVRRDTELERELATRYRSRGRPVPEIALRMADVVEGGEVLRNPSGSAPGQWLRTIGGGVVLLPGVPQEFEEIFTAHVLHRLGGGEVAARILHLAGVYESQVEQRVSHLYERFGRERVTILAARGQVHLVLTAVGAGAAAALDEMDAAFAAAAGRDLFGRDDDTLAGVVIEALRRQGWKVATAESCTGGLVGGALTAVPGSSDVFVGGVVAYSNELKERLLGVAPDLLAAHGAVSREAAEAMARGALALGAECAIATTGIAGPGGGSPEKPVGTLHIAVATPGGIAQALRRLPGDRALVREVAVNFALDMLRRRLEGDA